MVRVGGDGGGVISVGVYYIIGRIVVHGIVGGWVAWHTSQRGMGFVEMWGRDVLVRVAIAKVV